jgi:thiol:disulfide interchange protein
MPPPTSSRKQPEPARKSPWLAIAGLATVLLLAVVAIAYYMASNRTAPAAPGPVATPSASTAPAPIPKKHLYSETADPKAEIAAGLAQAKRERKRVILDFGGDWCGDCQVLDIYAHQAPNAELLDKNFVLVHVWIGHMDANIDVAAKYGVPISRGVPALAVLAPDGKVLYSQATGEFSDMRHMDPGSVTEFLEKWKI